ncbi:MAG: OsmC-related (seleno)protein [Pseudomonadota bacterium]
MSKPIITRRGEKVSLQTLPDRPFDKRQAAQSGIDFDMDVVVEPVPGTVFQKRASVSTNLPGYGSWEILCDEGVSGGGLDEAPCPLAFFSVGVACCLATHISGAIRNYDLKIESFRLEQRMRFHSTYRFAPINPEEKFGSTKSLHTNVMVVSDEPAERIHKLVGAAEQACFALNALTGQTQASSSVFHNGAQLAAHNP